MFAHDAAFHRATVTGSGRALIEQTLTTHFARPFRIVEAPPSALETAPISLAETDSQARAKREDSVERRVREHPSVREVLRILGGELEHVQLIEPDRPAESGAPELPDEPS